MASQTKAKKAKQNKEKPENNFGISLILQGNQILHSISIKLF